MFSTNKSFKLKKVKEERLFWHQSYIECVSGVNDATLNTRIGGHEISWSCLSFIFSQSMATEFRQFIEISPDLLPSLDYVTNLVHDDGAGAISTFSGTTRDTFEGNFNRKIYVSSLIFYRQKSDKVRI